jgi:predicted porin
MIGGLMKTTSRLTIATALAAFATTGAMAADLGGNCCSDLEERVAELEATTVRKGNRVQSLTIYGQVAKGIVWHDDGSVAAANEVTIRDMNGRSGTRFGLKGSAKIDSDLTAGFLIEIGVDNGQPINGAANPRYSQLILTSKRMGTVKVGQGSLATDGITAIKLGGAFSELTSAGESTDPSPTAAAAFNNNWDGNRQTGVVYNTPEFVGFVFYTGWYNGTNQNTPNAVTSYDFALRYANEFNGVRIAGGVGYRVIDNLTPTSDTEIWSGSASILHVASGLFLNGMYGQEEDDQTGRFGGAVGTDNSGWGISGGIARKFNPIGTTSIEVRFTEWDSAAAGVNPTSYGVGISQNIDAAAMDIYLLWENYDCDFNCDGNAANGNDDVNIITFGSRIRF